MYHNMNPHTQSIRLSKVQISFSCLQVLLLTHHSVYRHPQNGLPYIYMLIKMEHHQAGSQDELLVLQSYNSWNQLQWCLVRLIKLLGLLSTQGALQNHYHQSQYLLVLLTKLMTKLGGHWDELRVETRRQLLQSLSSHYDYDSTVEQHFSSWYQMQLLSLLLKTCSCYIDLVNFCNLRIESYFTVQRSALILNSRIEKSGQRHATFHSNLY